MRSLKRLNRHTRTNSGYRTRRSDGWPRSGVSLPSRPSASIAQPSTCSPRRTPGPISVGTITRRRVGTFVSDVLIASGRKQATINRIISSLSTLWRWLIKRGFVEANPWVGQGSFDKRPSRGQRPKRPYSKQELLLLLGADPRQVVGRRYGAALAELVRLGLLTGARLNELCELSAGDVLEAEQAIVIREGKTENARRLIPVHRLAWPLLLKRLQASGCGLLFPELSPGGPDGKRSWYATKRYTEFRRSDLGDDNRVDFHSLRRTFATYLERASTLTAAVNASVTAELMGHTKATLAFSLYSGGLTLDNLRRAIEALDTVLEPEILEAIRVLYV